MPTNSSEYQRGYRAGFKSAQETMQLKMFKELSFLRKNYERLTKEIAVSYVRPPHPPYMNLPSEDEESPSLESTGKNLRILYPDSSLLEPRRARGNGSGFYSNLDEAAAAFGKKDAHNK